MSDEAAFLEVLKANPADDTARLVYADWLDEHTEPAKAEYLRLVAGIARDHLRTDLGERVASIALKLPADWRLAAAARFGLVLELHDIKKKIEAIKFVREVTGMGLGEAKTFVESAPRGLLLRTTAECANGLQRHFGFVHLALHPIAPVPLQTPTFVTYTATAQIYPGSTFYDEGQSYPQDAFVALSAFLVAALGLSATEVESLARFEDGYAELARGMEYTDLAPRLIRWNELLPKPEPNNNWFLHLGCWCSLSPSLREL